MRRKAMIAFFSMFLSAAALTTACADGGPPSEESGSPTDSAISAGSATIDLPVTGYYYENNREVPIDIPKLNKELNKLGLDGIPEVVTMGKNPGAFHAVIMKRVKAANEKLNREMVFNVADEHYSQGHVRQWEHACYKGTITGLVGLIESLRGNFLYQDESILGIRAGAGEKIFDPAFKSKAGIKKRFGDEYEPNETAIDAWLTYKKTSKTALVLSDLGEQGDGTELYATEIPPCP